MRTGSVILRPSNVSKTLVCMDRRVQADYIGCLWNPYFKAPIQFSGLLEMIKRMENIMDAFYFPEPTFRCETFGNGKYCRSKQKNIREVRRYMGDDIFLKKSGEQATFVVHVQFRQNATWQGSIEWLEGKKHRKFRSMLEMMKLMDEALTENQKSDEEISWNRQSEKAI